MSNKKASNQVINGNGSSKQAFKPVFVGPLPMMNPYIPYLIALSFVALTALLTLLLTVALENKAQPEHTISLSRPEPLLADARIAFGQTDIADNTAGAAHQDESAVLVKKNAADSIANLLNVSSTFAEPAAVTPKTPGRLNVISGPPANTDPQLNAGLSQSEARATSLSGLDMIPPYAPREAAHATKTTVDWMSTEESDATLVDKDEAPLKALDNVHLTLEKIIRIHHSKISRLGQYISEQAHSRYQLETMVIQSRNQLEAQIRQLEDSFRTLSAPTVAAYERLASKRFKSFERIYESRMRVMQRTYQSLDQLREDYSQLLHSLRTRHRSNLA